MRRFYDDYARSRSVNEALVYFVSMEAMAVLGLLTTVGHLWGAEILFPGLYFYGGIVLMVFGVFGVLHAILTIQAIVRRLQSEASSPPVAR